MSSNDPRTVIRERLEADLDEIEEADVRSGVFCAEMGCGEREQEFLSQHPRLRCPYMGRVPDPSAHCQRLREEYHEVMSQ